MKHNVLVVDDNSSDTELLTMVLQTLRDDLEIYVARDGQEALDFLLSSTDHADFSSHTPSLVLLDIKMPRVDGLEVVKTLKSDPRTRTLPVLMFTSSAEGKDLQKSYEYGANGFIVKPVDFQEYQDLLRSILAFWLDANRLPDSELKRLSFMDSGSSPGVTVHECSCLLKSRRETAAGDAMAPSSDRTARR